MEQTGGGADSGLSNEQPPLSVERECVGLMERAEGGLYIPL